MIDEIIKTTRSQWVKRRRRAFGVQERKRGHRRKKHPFYREVGTGGNRMQTRNC